MNENGNTPGRPCSICVSPYAKDIASALHAGLLVPSVAAMYDFPQSSMYRHAAHIPKKAKVMPASAGGTAEDSGKPVMQVLPATAPDKEKLEAHCEWLRAMLVWESTHGAASKDLALLSSQLTSQSAKVARMNGAFEITHSQILRTPFWNNIVLILRDELRTVPEVMLRIAERIEELETQGKKVV